MLGLCCKLNSSGKFSEFFLKFLIKLHLVKSCNFNQKYSFGNSKTKTWKENIRKKQVLITYKYKLQYLKVNTVFNNLWLEFK